MEDAAVVVSVQRRDARLRTQIDSPVCLRAIQCVEDLEAGVLDVNPDPCRHDYAPAGQEDVEMSVDVMNERLLPLRSQPCGKGEAQWVCRGRPGSRALRRLRRGGDHGRRCDSGCGNTESADHGRAHQKAPDVHTAILELERHADATTSRTSTLSSVTSSAASAATALMRSPATRAF